ncbi:hypothetical protein H4R34_000334 [Dimargaris verticillata]|uniref:ArfGap-domain-containing protein n=1 Tax=Dimargaris verticillata TaxID=2761393 RepID=A0A9W8EFI4_9FUNG|nr:hypothetical protein H4R34_000334 [Dimargaris verticillata]
MVPLTDCLRDAPTYRSALAAQEEFVGQYETAIKNLTKNTKSTADVSRDLAHKYTQFADDLDGFVKRSFTDTDVIANSIDKFSLTLREIQRNRSMQASQLMDVFVNPLEEFVKSELGPVKDAKKRFDRASDDYEYVLAKCLGKRARDANLADAEQDVHTSKQTFLTESMDYAITLNETTTMKRLEFIEYVLAFMFTQYAFFHQGYEMLKDLEPLMRELTDHLHEQRGRYRADMDSTRAEKDRITQELAQNLDSSVLLEQVPEPTEFLSKPQDPMPIQKYGYMFLRTNYTLMASWNRRYFALEGNTLTHCDRCRDKDVDAINLQVATVKPAPQAERRFCFEIISPSKTYVLQAENSVEMQDWITCIQCAIEQSYANTPCQPGSFVSAAGASPSLPNGDNTNPQVTKQELIALIQAVPGNNQCADCQTPDPEWASINLGALLCIECSGIHRSLGVHVTKIRSLTLDNWEPEQAQVMVQLGNTAVNQVYEQACPSDVPRPTPEADRASKQEWIMAKYIERLFAPHAETTDPYEMATLNERMWLAAQQGDLPAVLQCLATGADVNWQNEVENHKTALHQAALQSNCIMVEFLLHWFADINAVDGDGRTSLHYAAAVNDAAFVWYLLKKHAKLDVMDKHGVQPLDVALDSAHVQVVMAIRYATFLRETASHGELSAKDSGLSFQEMLRPAYPDSQSVNRAAKQRSISEVFFKHHLPFAIGNRRQTFSQQQQQGIPSRTRHESLMPTQSRPVPPAPPRPMQTSSASVTKSSPTLTEDPADFRAPSAEPDSPVTAAMPYTPLAADEPSPALAPSSPPPKKADTHSSPDSKLDALPERSTPSPPPSRTSSPMPDLKALASPTPKQPKAALSDGHDDSSVPVSPVLPAAPQPISSRTSRESGSDAFEDATNSPITSPMQKAKPSKAPNQAE